MSILINSGTRVLVQGITGREAADFTRESIRYGTQVVAGVTPGKGGTEVHGIPVYDGVRTAMQRHDCTATVISVPAPFAHDAALEALSNGLRLLVIVTERVPRKDVVSILEAARECGAKVIGPNSLGVISPGQSRVGMCGGAAESIRLAYSRGHVGLMSRSGGMMTEIASLLTQAGIGQSTCVSIGGDPVVGSTFLDLLQLYEKDGDTRALVLFCEPGGAMEERLADHLLIHRTRLPIIAFVAGRFTDQHQGMRFGHAAVIVEGASGSPQGKIEALRRAGVILADKLSQIPELVKTALADEH